MLSRQARERQETADNGQENEPLGAHPDPLQKEDELEVRLRSSRTEGRSRWSKRVIIELRFSPDQRRQIKHLPAGRSSVEGQLANLTLARGDRNAEPAVRLPTK
jgi:hypothetical protein